MKEALGIDIGGVIIARPGRLQPGGVSDTSFASDDYLETPEIPGAINAIRQLVEKRFGGSVFLVSKAGPRTRVKTMRWLKHQRFFERTGVKTKHVIFCSERSEKETICRRLDITHFIDDRVDVLIHLKSVPHRYLFEPTSPQGGTSRFPRSTERVSDWNDVLRALLQP